MSSLALSIRQVDFLSIGGALGGALLGSSCCAVQLVLNYFSIGCAGFAVLDPYRPYFLGLSAASFGSMLYYNQQNGKPILSFRNAFSLALVVGLAALPKLVDYINHPAPPPEREQVYEVDVSGMKCMGCANAVHNALNRIDGVVQNQVTLDEHTAQIYVKGEKQLTDDDLENVLGEIGFGAKIAKRRLSNPEAVKKVSVSHGKETDEEVKVVS